MTVKALATLLALLLLAVPASAADLRDMTVEQLLDLRAAVTAELLLRSPSEAGSCVTVGDLVLRLDRAELGTASDGSSAVAFVLLADNLGTRTRKLSDVVRYQLVQGGVYLDTADGFSASGISGGAVRDTLLARLPAGASSVRLIYAGVLVSDEPVTLELFRKYSSGDADTYAGSFTVLPR